MVQQTQIRVGTRGSALALAQTKLVVQALQDHCPALTAEIVVLRTQGDKILNKPLVSFGGKGVFVTEFEEALRAGKIDLAVHSAKDMPMELGQNLVLAGTLPRADARDVLVVRRGTVLKSSQRLTVGTGSLRRRFQVQLLYPNAVFAPLRGNVTTRLQKLADGAFDAVVLAAAGLQRLQLDMDKRFTFFPLSCDEVLPAGGQGIIAVEARADSAAAKLAQHISDCKTFWELEAERKVLRLLDAGCHEAIGAFAEAAGDTLRLRVVRQRSGHLQRQDGTAAVHDRLLLAEKLAKKIKAEEAAWESSI